MTDGDANGRSKSSVMNLRDLAEQGEASSPLERDLRAMPPEIRQLESPWSTLVGSVPGLTEDLERDFRFGQSVVRFAGGYRLGGSIKGGSSTIWTPVGEQEFGAYSRWQEREGIPRIEDRAAYDELKSLLESNGIEFISVGYRSSLSGASDDYLPSRGYLYRLILAVLRALPAEHLERPEFSRFQLGGWGPDCAKASAYENGTVMIYDFAIRGARRTFGGLLLHEIGHAHDAALPPDLSGQVGDAHATIAKAYALIGLEFLLDSESRKVYQQFLCSEFVAETYVVYTSQGASLRSFIAQQPDEGVREAWERVYDVFREMFSGVEYE